MNTKPTRVLVVESDADDAALLSSYLACAPGSEENLDVTCVPRLSSACQLLSRRDFDAVLLDLALPQTSGLEGFLKVRALRPLVPVIVLTGSRDAVLAQRALKLGAQDHFIMGSADCLLLKRAIGYAIERARLSAALEGRREGPPDGELSAVEARNHFLGRISHELRNTLATMKTAAYCLRDDSEDKLTARQAQMVDMISRNIDRQTRIVENILDLARLRSGRLKIRFRQADAGAIISDLADEFKLSRGSRLLRVDVDGDLPSIDCDPDLIAQVLRNLLDNASRYAKERIEITATRAGGGGISVSVTDDGAGIPAERLGGLFTQFHQLEDDGAAAGHKGTGLGLAICREIIEGHHGRIRAENAAGSGARFSFELPVGGGADTPAEKSAPRAPDPVKRSYLLHK